MHRAVPPGAGRGLRLHLAAGDLDAMDGLVDLQGEEHDEIMQGIVSANMWILLYTTFFFA